MVKIIKQKNIARIAGVLYLIVAITGFYIPYVDGKLFVDGNALLTANNIMTSKQFFISGFLSILIMATSWIFLSFILYRLFKSVNKNIAFFMVSFVLVGSTIIYVSALIKLAALFILTGTDYFGVFGVNQTYALAMLFSELWIQGNHIAFIFFGLWLFPLGYLIFKSDSIPSILGVLIAISGIGYLADFYIYFFIPNFSIEIVPLTFWGEVFVLLWLLIIGVKVQPKKSFIKKL